MLLCRTAHLPLPVFIIGNKTAVAEKTAGKVESIMVVENGRQYIYFEAYIYTFSGNFLPRRIQISPLRNPFKAFRPQYLLVLVIRVLLATVAF